MVHLYSYSFGFFSCWDEALGAVGSFPVQCHGLWARSPLLHILCGMELSGNFRIKQKNRNKMESKEVLTNTLVHKQDFVSVCRTFHQFWELCEILYWLLNHFHCLLIICSAKSVFLINSSIFFYKKHSVFYFMIKDNSGKEKRTIKISQFILKDLYRSRPFLISFRWFANILIRLPVVTLPENFCKPWHRQIFPVFNNEYWLHWRNSQQ